MSVLALVDCLSHSDMIFLVPGMMGDFFFLLHPGHFPINLVILFRFSTWTVIYFCELLFQWQFNFQSFYGVMIFLVYLLPPLVHAGAAYLAEDVPQVGMSDVS